MCEFYCGVVNFIVCGGCTLSQSECMACQTIVAVVGCCASRKVVTLAWVDKQTDTSAFTPTYLQRMMTCLYPHTSTKYP